MSQLSHNSTARQQVMQEVHAELLPIEADIKALQKKAKTVKDRLKTIDMPLEVFNFKRKLLKLDKSDQERFLDNLKEAHEALSPGEQVNFLDFMDGQSGVDTAHVAKGDTRDVEVQRFEAGDSFVATNEFKAAMERKAAKTRRRGGKKNVADEGLAAAREDLGIDPGPTPGTVGAALAAAHDASLPMAAAPDGDDFPLTVETESDTILA